MASIRGCGVDKLLNFLIRISPLPVVNLYDNIAAHPQHFRQFRCGDCLLTMYNCPLESARQDLWSDHNYVVYVMQGRKIWHTMYGSYDLHEGSCVFVRKGACIVEQFFDVTVCLVMFFVPDDFICEVLKSKKSPVHSTPGAYLPLLPVVNSPELKGFYQSMMPYFESPRDPDQSLLHLKFRELILTIADDVANAGVLSYFCSLLKAPQEVSLQQVMEENFCYNLSLAEFARLSARSLSAFKRDFIKLYNSAPGKWLMEKRLTHALHLLTNLSRTVGETAFESGFESASHFSRAFRARFGQSPAALRQSDAILPL
jgi:AraC family transcriptional regulator, exoenzyme S synthesis regulatory protein ExsA